MSLALEPNAGALEQEIAERLANHDARHGELLDWLDEHGFGSTPQNQIPPEVYARARRELGHDEPPATAPAPHAAPAKEIPMPCGNCGGLDHNRRTCPKDTKEEKPAMEKPTKTKPRLEVEHLTKGVRAARSQRDFAGLAVEKLLQLRKFIDDELARREEQHTKALEAIRAARAAA